MAHFYCLVVFPFLLRLLGSNILAYYDLSVNLNIKVSKILYHWDLSLVSFRFCTTQYLHFTTRVFGHSVISPFLGGHKMVADTLTKRLQSLGFVRHWQIITGPFATLLRGLILSADFEHCTFLIFFRLIVYVFFSRRYMAFGVFKLHLIFSPLHCFDFFSCMCSLFFVFFVDLPITVTSRSCPAHLFELLESAAHSEVSSMLRSVRAWHHQWLRTYSVMIFPTLHEVRSDYALTLICGRTITCWITSSRWGLGNVELWCLN